jgi:hypothetical protein
MEWDWDQSALVQEKPTVASWEITKLNEGCHGKMLENDLSG